MSFEKISNVQVAQDDPAGALKSYREASPPECASRNPILTTRAGRAICRCRTTRWRRATGAGDLAGALKSYRNSLAIADRLAKSDPGNAGWRRDLSFTFGRLALVYRQSGDNAKARDSSRQGQAIMARLTKLSPDNAVWKNDLAWFDGQIAELAKR
jgi:hypothetical protein